MRRRAPHHLVEQLGALLAAEREALLAGDGDALAQAAHGKAQCLPELADALRALPPQQRRDAVQQLGAHVAELKRFNELNGAIVAARLAMNRARLEALLSAAGASTYGASGQVEPMPSAARAAAVSA